tara:strand:+ start:4439 stop:4612 length:174 start_codon:yes stop_codon:yes gene_type:complete
MEMEMNRDYFSRPIQGTGRSASDYGNTRLTQDEPSWGNAAWIAAFAVFLVVLCMVSA